MTMLDSLQIAATEVESNTQLICVLRRFSKVAPVV